MTSNKVLPKDAHTDFSLPGRFEEGSSAYFTASITAKPKNRGLYVMVGVFLVIGIGFFSYYFANQTEIDSKIIQNSLIVDPEKKIVDQFNVGKYGSEHAHAAIVFFVNEQNIDFSSSRFQLSSKYIHFENNNPYILHRHATEAPLEILFSSIGVKVSPDCLILSFYSENKNKFCSDDVHSLSIYVNGRLHTSMISNYVVNHNDRILISYGDGKSISKQLKYLESIEISNVPKSLPKYPGDGITI